MAYHPFSLIPSIASDNLFAERFNRLDNLFSRLVGDENIQRIPDYNIEQIDEKHYSITLSVPGFKEGELNISHGDDRLIIEGNHEEKSDEKKDKWIHKGIEKSSFSLSFGLDNQMKVTEAKLNDGLLKIVVEQTERDNSFKKIDIKS